MSIRSLLTSALATALALAGCFGVIDGPNPPPSPNSTAAPPAKSPPASAYRPSSG